MADLTLAYSDLTAAIYERRFPSSAPVSQWLAAAYADVWNAAQWNFKRVSRASFYTTADGLVGGTASATPLMPTALSRVTLLLDDQGNEVEQLDEEQFERRFTEQTASTGKPQAFTVVNKQIILWPTPDAAYLFKLSYRRRLATKTAGGTVQAGFFSADTDLPLWDDHHYILVTRSKIIGLRDRSDPTASDLVEEYQRALEAMIEEYVDGNPPGDQLPAWRP